MNSLGILTRIIHRIRERIDSGLIESEEGDVFAIGSPPKCEIRAEYLFFVDPVGDAVEEGLGSGGCYADGGCGRAGKVLDSINSSAVVRRMKLTSEMG